VFKLAKGKSGKFHFTLHPKNTQVVLTSEAYNSRASAVNGIASVRRNGGDRSRFETRTSKNGKRYFVLLAKNGEIIGQSQMYAHPTSVHGDQVSDEERSQGEDRRSGVAACLPDPGPGPSRQRRPVTAPSKPVLQEGATHRQD
jgi:uncharacterized protein